jgi:HK97 family phage major capsid protein
MTLEEKRMRESVGEYLDKMKNLMDKADEENRDFTKTEEKKYSELEKQMKAEGQKLDKFLATKNAVEDNSLLSKIIVGSMGGNTYSSNPSNVEEWERVDDAGKGDKIKVLSNKASLTNELGFSNTAGYNWRDYMRDRVAGFTARPKNAMDTSGDSSLVPTPLASQVIDLARNKSVCFRAGALTVPMTSKTLTIARITSDPSLTWKAENAIHTPSDVGTEAVTFTAKTLVGSVKMSVELSEDAPNASEVIANSLSQAIALELDRAALLASGSGAEPAGIYKTGTGVQTGVNEIDLGTNGTYLSNYDYFSQAYREILESNGEPNAAIFAPRTWYTIDTLKDTTNQPLIAPQSWQDLQKLVTNQIPVDMTKGGSSDASLAFLGDFTKMLFGIRTSLKLEVTRVGSHSDGSSGWDSSAWEQLQVWVRAYLRADIQLAQPSHFSVINGIVPQPVGT